MTDYEFYETPDCLTRFLCRAVSDKVGSISGIVAEPCAGSGAIVRALGVAAPYVELIETNDIDPRWCKNPQDATLPAVWDRWRGVDWVITNPPFSHAIAIADQAIRAARVGVAMHLRASIHEVLKTGIRRTWMNQHTPTGLVWLPRVAYQRSRSTGKWTTDSVTGCWVVWIKNHAEQFLTYAPESVLEELDAETPAFRSVADSLCGYTGSEADRQRQHVDRWKEIAA